MDIAICFLLFVCVYQFTFQYEMLYRINTPNVFESWLIDHYNVRSVLECAHVCMRYQGNSFLFDPQSLVCKTYRNSSYTEDEDTQLKSQYYVKVSTNTNLTDCGDVTCTNCSGVYPINPDNTTAFDVYCDTDTANGPWTNRIISRLQWKSHQIPSKNIHEMEWISVKAGDLIRISTAGLKIERVIQKRYDGSVDFYRNWFEYKKGFGSPYGEYWLGMTKIRRLLSLDQKLRINLEGWNGTRKYAEYTTFEIEDEAHEYQLTLEGFQGTVVNQLESINGMNFSTKDRDNDISGTRVCSTFAHGAWWYRNCYNANPNGKYSIDNGKNVKQSMTWNYFYQGRLQPPLKKCSMMVKRKTLA